MSLDVASMCCVSSLRSLLCHLMAATQWLLLNGSGFLVVCHCRSQQVAAGGPSQLEGAWFEQQASRHHKRTHADLLGAPGWEGREQLPPRNLDSFSVDLSGSTGARQNQWLGNHTQQGSYMDGAARDGMLQGVVHGDEVQAKRRQIMRNGMGAPSHDDASVWYQ
jgi:hypothetical protein